MLKAMDVWLYHVLTAAGLLFAYVAPSTLADRIVAGQWGRRLLTRDLPARAFKFSAFFLSLSALDPVWPCYSGHTNYMVGPGTDLSLPGSPEL